MENEQIESADIHFETRIDLKRYKTSKCNPLRT